jgi:ATP-dependent RNA helicase HelY
VLEPDPDSDEPRPVVLTEHRWAGRISSADYSGAAGPIGTMSLPKRVEHRQPRVRRDLASALRSAAAGIAAPQGRRGRRGSEQDPDIDPELIALREQMRRHPAHSAGDREPRARVAERYLRVERDNALLQKKIGAATNSLALTFDRIVGLLTERGYIEAVDSESEVTDFEVTDFKVTDDGRLLARIYSESDLLVAECLRTGAWNGLAAAELGAVLSAVVFETRGSDGPTTRAHEASSAAVRKALAQTRRLSGELRADENRHRIAPTREPDDGFVNAVYRWATSGDLASALAAADEGSAGTALSAGDFVRWCRQVLDLLDQVRNAAREPALRTSAKRAIEDVRRGVVAVDGG